MYLKQTYILIILTLLSYSCTSYSQDTIPKIDIIGTWQLLSHKTIKEGSNFINEKVFASGGGRYELDGHIYTESLEFCNYRPRENNEFDFTLELKGDTLIQSRREDIAELNISQKIIEKYIRVNK